ncbi:MAG: HEAT repeat domain-containing protein [Phycisphaerae bacterium]
MTIGAVGALCAAAVGAPPGDRGVLLRNDVSDGRLSVYRMTRSVVRARQQAGHAEELTYDQRGTWTRFSVREQDGPVITLAQMVVEGAAEKVVFRRDGAAVAGLSDGAQGEGVARVRAVHDRSGDGGDRVVARCGRGAGPRGGALAAVVDFAVWTPGRRHVGDEWSRELTRSDLTGEQKLKLRRLTQRDKRSYAELELSVSGKLRGAAAGCDLEEATAEASWSLGREILDRISGRVKTACGSGDAAERVEIQFTIELERTELLSGARAAEVAEQLQGVARAVTAARRGDAAAVRRAAAEFRERWPKSDWLAGVDQLTRETGVAPPPVDEDAPLIRELVLTLKAWQQATGSGESAAVSAARRNFERLADGRGGALKALATGAGENQRAAAVFALAFSTVRDPRGDLEQAARDSAPAVRAWALYGLALRADRATDRAIVVAALSDADSAVRARGCQAVAACLPRDCREMRQARQRMMELLQQDRSDATRLFAAKALTEVSSSEQVPALRKAIKHEVDPAIREQIRAAVARHESGP